MKKAFWILIASYFLSAGSSLAQTNNTLLWEISGNGLEKPSYLFGTFHLLCPDDLVVTNAIKTKLKATEQLALELDFDDPNMMAEMQQGMVFSDGKTTKDYLKKKELELVSAFFQDSLGINFDQVAAVKPFLLASFLYPKYLGCQPASWEMTLTALAQAQQAEVLGLETPQRQLAAIDQMAATDQAKMLVEGIADYSKMKQMMTDMVSIYQSQEVEKLYNYSNGYFEEYAGMEQAMLEARNREWIPKITAWSKTKPTFYAVGAGHLGGPTGVIALLREQGFQVTPVANVDVASLSNTGASAKDPAALIARKWRLDESVIPMTVEGILENVAKQNPEQAMQLSAQKGMLEDGMRASVFEYKADGHYQLTVLGSVLTGSWSLSDDHKQLIRIQSDGEKSVNEIVELTPNRMVIINSEKKTIIYVAK